MTGLGATFKATRARMVEMESESISSEFTKRFGLSEGDYLEVKRRSGRTWQPCRILSVSDCYCNQGGGYTATVLVAALLVSGRTGVGRNLMICTDFGGRGIKGIGKEVRCRREDHYPD